MYAAEHTGETTAQDSQRVFLLLLTHSQHSAWLTLFCLFFFWLKVKHLPCLRSLPPIPLIYGHVAFGDKRVYHTRPQLQR